MGKDERAHAFVRLQTLLLVEVRGEGRWAVHPFVAEHIKRDTAPDMRRRLLRDLCDFSRAGIRNRRFASMTYASLAAYIRACRYAQRAGDLQRSAEIIKAMSSTAKKLGLYSALRDLCHWHVTGDPNCDPWIRYHLAHCEMILGDIPAAITILDFLRSSDLEPALTYTSARVLADCHAKVGDLEEGIDELRQVIAAGAPAKSARRGVQAAYQQMKTTLAVLLAQAGRSNEARQLATEIIAESHDERTRAVVQMALGLSDAKRSPRSAERHFRSAMKMFRSCEDRRGEAWSQRHVAELVLRRAGIDQARRHIKDVVAIHARTGETSDEYGDWLARMRAAAGDDLSINGLLGQELLRMGRDAA